MRTTIRIDDELLTELKEQALRKRVSLTQLVNQILCNSLQDDRRSTARNRQYHEDTQPLGIPRVDLSKAIALAAYFENEESVWKMTMRK